MTRQRHFLLVILASVVCLGALYLGVKYWGKSSRQGSLDTVSFRNPIPTVTTGQTPLFLAREKGFFKEHGLDVKFEQGSAALNPISMVAAGNDDLGMIGGPDTLIVARSKGIPVKAVAVLHRNANFVCLVTLKEKGISDVSQLDEKKVGFFYGHISTDVLRNLFRKKNINVTEVDVGFDYNQLIAGQLDAQWAFTVRAALQLPAEGVEVNIIRPEDYGIITHGYTIFALEKTIEEHPEIIERFLQAAFQGIEHSLDHPDEATNLILALNPSLDRDFAERSQAMFDKVTSNTDRYPIGYMDREMFQETYDRLLEEGVLESEFDISEVYTTEFLERIHGRAFD